jgi:hypothetical protein
VCQGQLPASLVRAYGTLLKSDLKKLALPTEDLQAEPERFSNLLEVLV